MNRAIFAGILWSVIAPWILSTAAGAAPTADTRREVAQIRTIVGKAERLLSAGKPRDAVEPVQQALDRLARLVEPGADADLVKLLAPLMKELEEIHALLELQGLKLPALPALGANETETPADKPVAGGARPDPTSPVARATGKETVRFALDVAPLFVQHCLGCHGATRPRAELSLATFAGLASGSESGAIVVPGKPQSSMLIKKLRGTAGERMPLERPPLPDEAIAKIEAWISEGAKFDGSNVQLPLPRLAAAARAQALTPEELSRQRAEISAEHWRLAFPKEQAGSVTSGSFLLLGNVDSGALEEVAGLANKQSTAAAALLTIPSGTPAMKGRLTIYVFAHRFDYAEFGTMVEKRDLPQVWRSHWQFDPMDPYLALVWPPASGTSPEALVAQHLASLFVVSATGDNAPRWFAEGAGRAVAAALHPADARVKSWDEAARPLLSQLKKPEDFMSGKPSLEEADILSYSFVKLMTSSPRQFSKLLKSLGQGTAFDLAVAQAYQGSPAELAAVWAARVAREQR